MKLRTFNTETASHQINIPVAYIYMNHKRHQIVFSKECVEKLGITVSTQLQFHQDESEKVNWYLEIVQENGFQLRPSSKWKRGGMQFCNAKITNSIFESLETDKASGRIFIGETVKYEGRELITLITASLTT